MAFFLALRVRTWAASSVPICLAAVPTSIRKGTARLIPAGATLNFQIHYSRTTGKPEKDATSVGLIFAKEPPTRISRRIDLSNQMFLVPAGDPDQEVTECHTFDKNVLITSLTPHMHLRGKAMQIIADLPGGQRETLLFGSRL